MYTGAGGGWVGNVIFNQVPPVFYLITSSAEQIRIYLLCLKKQKGLAYLRTDIGGAYKLNPSSGSWTPLLDWANTSQSDYWGVESIATDPVNPQNVYIEVSFSLVSILCIILVPCAPI